jgi:hypothetical protein
VRWDDDRKHECSFALLWRSGSMRLCQVLGEAVRGKVDRPIGREISMRSEAVARIRCDWAPSMSETVLLANAVFVMNQHDDHRIKRAEQDQPD